MGSSAPTSWTRLVIRTRMKQIRLPPRYPTKGQSGPASQMVEVGAPPRPESVCQHSHHRQSSAAVVHGVRGFQGAGFRVQGSGCRVQGAGCRVRASHLHGGVSRQRATPAHHTKSKGGLVFKAHSLVCHSTQGPCKTCDESEEE